MQKWNLMRFHLSAAFLFLSLGCFFANGNSCVELFLSPKDMPAYARELSQISGFAVQEGTGSNPQLRLDFFNRLRHMSSRQIEQLGRFIQENYRSISEKKETDKLALSIRRLMDVAVAQFLPADQFFIRAKEHGLTGRLAFLHWIKHIQESLGLRDSGVTGQNMINFFEAVQRKIRLESERNYDANFWNFVVYGSSVNGRALSGISDIDIKTDSKAGRNFFLEKYQEEMVRQAGFSSASVDLRINLDLTTEARLSTVAVRITATEIRLIVFRIDPETGLASIIPELEFTIR